MNNTRVYLRECVLGRFTPRVYLRVVMGGLHLGIPQGGYEERFTPRVYPRVCVEEGVLHLGYTSECRERRVLHLGYTSGCREREVLHLGYTSGCRRGITRRVLYLRMFPNVHNGENSAPPKSIS